MEEHGEGSEEWRKGLVYIGVGWSLDIRDCIWEGKKERHVAGHEEVAGESRDGGGGGSHRTHTRARMGGV